MRSCCNSRDCFLCKLCSQRPVAVDESAVHREPKRPTAPRLPMVTILLRSRRWRGFALLFSARRFALAAFSATLGSIGWLQVGSLPPLSGALALTILPAAGRRSCLLNRLPLLLSVRRLVRDIAGLARSWPLQRLLFLLPMLRLVGDTAGLARSCPLQRLPFPLPMLRLIGDTAGLARSWAASAALKLPFAARSWRPFRSHSWPTGRRSRSDLLARFSCGLPARGPRRR